MWDLSSSLYIHVPFCASLCDYCDFYSIIPASDDAVDAFLAAAVSDIKSQLEYFNVREILSVYVGGGTPSVLGKRIGVLLGALKELSFPEIKEITVEANPESATEEFLAACREGGVTRLSVGAQTFHAPSRKAVNRIGNVDSLKKSLELCAGYFNGHLSVDLITGLPYQNEKTAIDDARCILSLNPAHVSLYSLSLGKGTILQKRVMEKDIVLPDADSSDAIWFAAKDALENAGFKRYEVSNFALDGKKCQHNLRYWRMEGWLGAGPSASGTVVDENRGTAKRFTYASDVYAYIKNPFINTAFLEELGKADLIRESVFMGYRLREGPDEEIFKRRFNRDIKDCIPRSLERWKDRDKTLFLNSFLMDAFKELDGIMF